jgi:hypothetical protein
MNTDFDIDSSLDVAISMFLMVGGQQPFLEVCGGSMNSNTNQVFSMKKAKALEMQTTLHKISSSLKDLEANMSTRFKIIEERIKQAQVTQSSMRGVVKRLDTSNIEALYKDFFPDDIKLCHDI